jgi:hypothetical protein
MKRYSLLLLPLVAVVFAVSCRDTTSPANSHKLLSPPDIAGIVGKPPPPPVDAAIAVTITSLPATAIFTGVFFNNGSIHDDGSGVAETFDGMAWLRFDNKQPDAIWPFSSAATSANARFMVKGDDRNCLVDPSTCATGNGTLTIGGVDYKIVEVFSFERFSSCGLSPEAPDPCAHIEFRVTDPAGGSHVGRLIAFDKSECLGGTDPKTGLPTYDCDLPPIPPTSD